MNHSQIFIPESIAGVYTVIAELPLAQEIAIGRRGKANFSPGFYAYVGSALNGLKNRLSRHLGKRKNLHWHIDYLLDTASVREIIYAPSSERLECRLARSLARDLSAVPHFGCSDCRCVSHLFHCPHLDKLSDSVSQSFERLNLVATTLLLGSHK